MHMRKQLSLGLLPSVGPKGKCLRITLAITKASMVPKPENLNPEPQNQNPEP